jgi:DNA-binding transcriptional regulator YdaS (Cro superfamily)
MIYEDEKRTALAKAIWEVRGVTALARALSESGAPITPQAISQWKHVPSLRVIEVERLSGIPRHELRPDIYPALDTPKTHTAINGEN